MKLTVKCPRCRSPQKFGTQKRKVDADKIELYIQCQICRWKKSLLVESADTISLYQDIEKLKVRALNDSSLYRVLRNRIKRLKNE